MMNTSPRIIKVHRLDQASKHQGESNSAMSHHVQPSKQDKQQGKLRQDMQYRLSTPHAKA